MSDPEPFLRRWSRRKREAAEADEGTPQSDRGVNPDHLGDAAGPEKNATDHCEPPPFDPAVLPPIESINATTDIRAFLAPLVPSALKHAALRRVWATDAKIRDFVGLADYDWDFNIPGSMAGFGPLEATAALQRQLADLIGNAIADGGVHPKISEAAPMSSVVPPDPVGPRQRRDALQQNSDTAQRLAATSHPKVPGMMDDEPARAEDARSIVARKHGQALPK
jgi:hypothetical protein